MHVEQRLHCLRKLHTVLNISASVYSVQTSKRMSINHITCASPAGVWTVGKYLQCNPRRQGEKPQKQTRTNSIYWERIKPANGLTIVEQVQSVYYLSYQRNARLDVDLTGQANGRQFGATRGELTNCLTPKIGQLSDRFSGISSALSLKVGTRNHPGGDDRRCRARCCGAGWRSTNGDIQISLFINILVLWNCLMLVNRYIRCRDDNRQKQQYEEEAWSQV